MEVQEKWLYLDRLFFDTNIYLRPTQDFITFESVVQEFKTFQHKINLEPSVNQILKDESYKTKLDEWNTKLSKIITTFDNYLDNICQEFPRFYFIEKEKLIDTLSHIRDCRKYINTVKSCFPGINELIYDLPHEEKDSKNKNRLNLDINCKLNFFFKIIQILI